MPFAVLFPPVVPILFVLKLFERPFVVIPFVLILFVRPFVPLEDSWMLRLLGVLCERVGPNSEDTRRAILPGTDRPVELELCLVRVICEDDEGIGGREYCVECGIVSREGVSEGTDRIVELVLDFLICSPFPFSAFMAFPETGERLRSATLVDFVFDLRARSSTTGEYIFKDVQGCRRQSQGLLLKHKDTKSDYYAISTQIEICTTLYEEKENERNNPRMRTYQCGERARY